MSKLTLAVTIGGTRRVLDASQRQGADIVADEILSELTKDAAGSINLELSKLAKNLPKVVENSYVGAINYAANHMIGLSSPRGAENRSANGGTVTVPDPDRDLSSGLAKWQVLSPRTIKEQNALRGTKDSGKFFSQTGGLKAEMLTMAREMVKRTGVIRVTYHGKLRDARGRFVTLANAKTKVGIGNFSIRLLPNVNPASLPGVRTGNVQDHDPNLSFERKLGFSAEAIRKLRGAGRGDFTIAGTHRPMMQPIFTYWTLNRIPQIIARSINNSLPARARIDNSSGQSYSV